MSEPTWLPVVSFEGYYEVSDSGLVRSVTRKGVGRRGVRGRVLRPFPDDAGYLKVNLAKDGKTVTRRVHQLVLEAFVEPCPPGMEGRHYPDPDKSNNSLANLSWGTKARNTLDQVEHGTHREARKACCPTCNGPYKVHQQGKTKGKRYCPACGNANRRKRQGHDVILPGIGSQLQLFLISFRHGPARRERDAASDAAILEDAIEVLRLRFGVLTAGDLIAGLGGAAASIRAHGGIIRPQEARA